MPVKKTTARSQRELAKLVGRDPGVVCRWVSDARWPFPRKPPWNVAAVQAWMTTALSENPADDGAKPAGLDVGVERTAKIVGILERGKVAAERTKLLKLQREIEEKKWHRVDQCLARLARQIAAIADEFRIGHPRRCAEKLARQLVPHVRGFDEAQLRQLIQSELETNMRAIVSWFAGERPNPYPDPEPPPTFTPAQERSK